MSKKNIVFYMIGFVAGQISYEKYEAHKTATKNRHERILNNIAMYTN